MTINYTRISAFIFLLIFLIYSYLAGEIRVFAFDENADFNARTFPKLISYLGIIVSLLTLVLSKNEEENMSQYEWISVIILFALVFSYGLLIKTIGFFVSTNLFLIVSYLYLGVRSYKVIILSSLPVVAGLQFMLHGLLDVYIRDPFLQFLGVIS
ncbi:tripartite tricarboxylate transporter TctB family protein [Candidatus Pseudothioglobus singularis]|jgi:putative tricarboxylic transport membrane protein|nr:tripartite tricarboxylate transporter TctB family protein [Candidatus Pseudothioglobus singularis]MDB4849691.1 tripartite tricarboxylate transporter TctB family protein [bacterium]MDG1166721.1 tripartite tricarboxylate transporter TctB family protein [Candidatus Thioglobus sp.]MDA8854676.1 tripartite tricarboxylate transporter TctB family protein [Candidatus Pseudothioglobus singularis]MDA9030657.1 tripartite tricarboxylate transporter TctB family protein [Candidatus Pseudothioglobus singula|tara:strand:+ start:166 stop:630 length:465 start_codon:yes stop_codon:yes gene_type:complete